MRIIISHEAIAKFQGEQDSWEAGVTPGLHKGEKMLLMHTLTNHKTCLPSLSKNVMNILYFT